MTTIREAIRWRKSSLSDGQDTCVELAHTGTAVRDSKNPTGPTLTLTTDDLLTAIRTGRLDR
ncbi:DUF397 domain-containing protein [Actinophytocola glycyrrhizae]|uniref:DUF397 domain-containing protein n=1 Tax=Actinophytocola glycyrrhizae TaxID=2044873 RepID=A0ABV9S3C7_9PSEU